MWPQLTVGAPGDQARPKEEILAQYPLPGQTVLRGHPVDLLVSSGAPAESIAMADLRGLTLDQAIDAIESRHLVLGQIRRVQNATFPDDVVLEHEPQFGYPVSVGSRVDITVNQHLKAADGRNRGIPALFRYRAPEGFLKQHVRVTVNRPGLAVDLFDDFLRPGREIWIWVPQHTSATLLMYIDGELAKTKRFD